MEAVPRVCWTEDLLCTIATAAVSGRDRLLSAYANDAAASSWLQGSLFSDTRTHALGCCLGICVAVSGLNYLFHLMALPHWLF